MICCVRRSSADPADQRCCGPADRVADDVVDVLVGQPGRVERASSQTLALEEMDLRHVGAA